MMRKNAKSKEREKGFDFKCREVKLGKRKFLMKY